jgi:hypothetical protein
MVELDVLKQMDNFFVGPKAIQAFLSFHFTGDQSVYPAVYRAVRQAVCNRKS